MRNYNYSNRNKENNLIRKFEKMCKENPKKVRYFAIAVVVLIIVSLTVSILVEEGKKQKYVEYDGENLNEAKGVLNATLITFFAIGLLLAVMFIAIRFNLHKIFSSYNSTSKRGGELALTVYIFNNSIYR